MAGIYGSGSGIYGGGSGSQKPSKKKGRSILGDILHGISSNPIVKFHGNMASDLKDMAFGLPTGLVSLGKDPIKSLETMADSTWHTWSPLFHGDFAKFGMEVYDHPLAPILDVLSVLTLGAGSAARGAKVLGDIGIESATISKVAAAGRAPSPRILRNPIDEGAGSVVHSKPYAGNPFIRARQLGQERAVNGLAALLPSMFGVGKDINKAFIDGSGRSTLRGKQRADAWRWYTRERFDAASRQHALSSAVNTYISTVVGRSKRLNEDTYGSMQVVAPHMIQQLHDHAHIVRENELAAPMYRTPSPKEVKAALTAERRKMRKEGIPKDSGGWNARLAAIKAAKTVPNVGAHLRPEYRFAKADAEVHVQAFIDAYEAKHGWTPEKFHDYLKGEGDFDGPGRSYASQIVTDDWTKAARTDAGEFRVVRNHQMDPFLLEAANTVSFLGKLWKQSTNVWKWAVLAARPAYLVNNSVGNMFMYSVSSGPQGFRGLVDAYRQLRDPAVIRQEITRAEKQLFRLSSDWQDRYFLGLHRGFSRDVQEQLGTVRVPIGSKKAKFARLVGGGLYDITHQVSDVFLRRAMVNNIMRAHPEVQDLMKQGYHFDDAAASVAENRAVREAVQHQVNDTLGQYHYLNPAERAVRAIVPFYTWDRAIARHGAHLFLDKPTTAAFMTETGYIGVETTEQLLGEIPEFLNSALPLSLLGMEPDETGRLPILGTTGINPYSSLAALVDTTAALLTGGSDIGPALATQLHPFITGSIEATTGTRMLTGARMPEGEGGLLPRVLGNTLVSLPEFQVGGAALGGPQGTGETLFAKDLPQYLSAFLGVPVKELSQKAARAMAERQDGVPVKRKKKRQGIY